tara:strand:- start:13537 stop:14775 length:1239 start_codon:yes stop_codon:yes gene_type:complete
MGFFVIFLNVVHWLFPVPYKLRFIKSMQRDNVQICPSCGAKAPVQAAFCPSCSHNLKRNAQKRRVDPLEGMILDQKYHLIKKIGEGGMAKVYKAEHVFLRELRAIKMIKRPDHRRETQYGRFLREARLARKVSAISPHVIRIDDFGYDQKQGVYYYSMELLKGESLREILRKPPYYLTPERTAQLAAQICSAMSIGHEEGMVHRDLKPDNIFLTSYNGQPDFVKILDFGLAKPLDPDEPDFTEVGKVVGTPEYMSPEQCRGPTPDERVRGISHVDGRADLYSLGIVMYQCLAGRAPFTLNGEPTPQNFLKLMSRQISEKPVPLLSIRKNIPPGLAEVVKKALKKNPERRFQSMRDMQTAVMNAMPDIHYPFLPEAEKSDKRSSALSLNRTLRKQTPPAVARFQLQLDPELDY